ncbi:acetamidase/formamidase family protein [Bradyrhizobium sp. CCH5-F6]|uniref:acetamidase/formamidase family protein n=1 Tax=Bradyrhizobium sp. CCH5-F6 TaxID=1768753 RepID=UPI00076A34EF|nr:acetamidase/formamidase family protein [Bradyrhizobium sp. CCH5-F6]
MAFHSLAVDRTVPLADRPREGHNRWHPCIEPMCRVCSGDTVEIETRDSFDCQICATTTSKDLESAKLERAHPLTGPVYVEGAEEGDLLAVHVKDVQPHDEGFTVIMPGFGYLRDLFTEPHIVHWEMEKGFAYSPQLPNIRIPGAPFMGVMGVAPSQKLLADIIKREQELIDRGGFAMPPNSDGAVPSGERFANAIRTIAPHETGGNLDIKQLVAGTTLYIPVYEKGALFSVGDAHFAQGDGESCGTAIETSAVFTAKFEILKGEARRRGLRDVSFGSEYGTLATTEMKGPYYATTGTCITRDGKNLSEDISLATRNALLNMLEYLCDKHGYSTEQAYSIISVAANLRISQIVDVPNVTVSAFLPLDIFMNR